MKIKFADRILDTRVVKSRAVGDMAYWRIEYLLGDDVVYACHSCLIPGTPSPLEALCWQRDKKEPCGRTDEGARQVAGQWCRVTRAANSVWLQEALDQIVGGGEESEGVDNADGLWH